MSGERCPNDGTEMVRVTWHDRAIENQQWGESLMNDVIALVGADHLPGALERIKQLQGSAPTPSAQPDPTQEDKQMQPDEVQFFGCPHCGAVSLPHRCPREKLRASYRVSKDSIQLGETLLSREEAIRIASDIFQLLQVHESAAPTPSAWQDINSAPKDGTWILVSNGKRPVVVHWSDDWTLSGVFRWTDSEYTFEATHWLPLPPPPPEKERS